MTSTTPVGRPQKQPTARRFFAAICVHGTSAIGSVPICEPISFSRSVPTQLQKHRRLLPPESSKPQPPEKRSPARHRKQFLDPQLPRPLGAAFDQFRRHPLLL